MAEQKHEYSSPVFNALMKLLPFLAWLPRVNAQTLRADMIAGITRRSNRFATRSGIRIYCRTATAIRSLYRHGNADNRGTIWFFTPFDFWPDHGNFHRCIFCNFWPCRTRHAGICIPCPDVDVSCRCLSIGVWFGRDWACSVNFVSHTVVIGFTAGAAILIATSQMKNVLGIKIPKGESFIHTWADIWHQMDEINLMVLMIAGITLVSALVIRKFSRRAPNLLLALVLGSVCAWWLNQGGNTIELIGEIPGKLATIRVCPSFSLGDYPLTIAPDAFAIAFAWPNRRPYQFRAP